MSMAGSAQARARSSSDTSAWSSTPSPRRTSDAGAKIVTRAQQRFDVAVSLLERSADLLVVSAGIFTARAIYEALQLGRHVQYSANFMSIVAVSFAFMFVFMLDWDGGYQRGNSLLRIRETERILRVTVTSFLLVFPITFLAGQLFSRWLVGLAMLIIPLFLVMEKHFFWYCVRWMHARGYGVENVLVYGAGFTGRRVFSALVRSPKLGLNPVAVVDDNPDLAGETVFEYSYRRNRSVRVSPGPITKEMIQDLGARVLMIAIPLLPQVRFDEVLAEAIAADARVAFVPKVSFSPEFTTNCADIDGLLVSELGRPPDPPAYQAAKRLFDLVGTLGLFATTLPVWLIAALLVKLDSPGPVLFSQMRIGRGGKPFRLFKFRSMYVEASKYAVHPQEAHDPRITRVGRILRRTSLDELPQLINVLKGEMSLVGPRPEMPFIVDKYDEHHRQRLAATPGITGLWQLSADRAFLIHENILYDLYYIRHRNFFMDVAILLHTVVFAMRGI
jgi:exopolysaccharide biosynthesis polyprenyl glycosylphosphotransferase